MALFRRKNQVRTAVGPLVDIVIVGEASYQPRIAAIRSATNDGEFTIQLVPEPANPYDTHAVAVVAGGGIVGYLPRDLASHWQPVLLAAASEGFAVVGKAQVFGGTPEKPNLGVFGSAVWPGRGDPPDRWHRE